MAVIVSVLFLISLFLVIAVYLIMVGMHFIGLAYLLVYIGAIAILFLFTIMLMNIRVSELLSYTNNSIPLAIIFSIIMYNSLYWISTPVAGTLNLAIDMSSSYKWDGVLVSSSHISSIGNIMYTSHSIWLIITGVILLVSMVGSIVITLQTTTKGPIVNNNNLYKLSNKGKYTILRGNTAISQRSRAQPLSSLSTKLPTWGLWKSTRMPPLAIGVYAGSQRNKSSLQKSNYFGCRALVVWGTNLGSTVGFGRLTRQVSNMIKLPSYQLSVIIGLLLSDGWLIFVTVANKNARLGFAQSGGHAQYLCPRRGLCFLF
jgi:NADH-ubiquinone oxidoreductase chain 6